MEAFFSSLRRGDADEAERYVAHHAITREALDDLAHLGNAIVAEVSRVFLRDYLQLVKARANTVWEAQVTKDEWVDLLAGRPSLLVDGVHDPDDPEPSYDVLWGELTGGAGYSCAC